MSGIPDVGELIAATEREAGMPIAATGKPRYETTAGGFSSGQGEERTAPSREQPAPAPQPTGPVRTIGVTQEADVAPDPVDDADGGIDYDAIIEGLTASAQAERRARQEIQAALAERDARLVEESQFRQTYEPHIKELAELWPEIEKQAAELEQVKKREALHAKKLELYRSAAKEAGLDIDDSTVDRQFREEQLERMIMNLPEVIDQRVARVFDSRTENYSRQEREEAARAFEAAETARRQKFVADKLDKFYTENPDLKDFDRFIRNEVEVDPNVDLGLVTAPFSKLVQTKTAKRRGAPAVDPGGSEAVGTAASTAPGPYDPARFANLGIDGIIAKMRRDGLM